MIFLDMRTVILGYTVSTSICAAVIAVLWLQNRRHYSGLGFWLANFVIQVIASLLISLRGFIPDLLSMTVANGLVIGGTILQYIGLEHFLEKRGAQVQNLLLILAFLSLHAYFVHVQPSLQARTILLSLTLLAVGVQGAWLMLFRVEPGIRTITRWAGIAFIGYCLASLVRIGIDLVIPPQNDFFSSNTYDTLVVLTYQMLVIIMTFSLFLMVNQRLFRELEEDIAVREQAEGALWRSEDKFAKAFHTSPDSILITRLSDGRLVEMNEGFSCLSGYGREEALGKTTLDLGLWVEERDREDFIAALCEHQVVRDREYKFRVKSGAILCCLCSGEIIQLDKESHIISVVRDITARKQTEERLYRQNEILMALQDTTLDLLSELDLDTLLENIVKRAGLLMSTTAGYLDLIEPETGQLKPRVGLGALGESLDHPVGPGEGVAGTVWQTGQPLVVNDYDRWGGRLDSFSKNMVGAVIGVPMISGDRVLGVLGLAQEAATGKVFIQEDVELLTRFAHLAMMAIENARLYAAAQQELADRKRAEEIIRLRLRLWESSAVQPLGALMQNALDEIEKITHSSIGFYHFVQDDQRTISLQVWSTRTLAEYCQAEGRGLHYSIDEAGVWVDCVRQRKPVIHNDYASLPHRKGLPEGHAALIRELVVPTMRDGRVVAILGVGNKPSDYDDKDVELVAYIADIIWGIVERKQAEDQIRQLNSRLEHLAMTDDLTGLPNRRAFFGHCEEEFMRAQRYRVPFSLLIMDIDEFKLINDTFGHDAGDRMLQCLANTLRKNIREIDRIGRLGGEEFGVLLPNTKKEEAAHLAERLRQAVEAQHCTNGDLEMRVTVSVGVATCEHVENLEAVVKGADRALYRAKDRGRNQVVVFE
ncbi:MAG: diguanylate cyclase [Anaerolineales bacterium]|nr:diguanylate cyclase [Anaerolineales bacterium]